MANGYFGEKDITLHDIKYKMTVNLEVIAEFQSESGHDFMYSAMKAINAFQKSRQAESLMERAEMMTKAVPMDIAAHLFYIAAKYSNKQIEFGEIQEALLMEGAIEAGEVQSYPILFVELVEFALLGVTDTLKKKNSKKLEKSCS